MRHCPILIVLCGGLLAGCVGANHRHATPDRLEQGLVVLLPGIEGEGPMAYSVRDGLLDAGCPYGITIYRWGRPVPLAGPLLNQIDVIGNRLAANDVAKLITEYQDAHPDRPVYMVGHSAGGGIAVFAAEALPEGRRVDGLVLLSPSLSAGYDLTKALAKSRQGIVNFHSTGDVGLLVIGTTVAGNVDGAHGPAAGAAGFKDNPPGLYQVPWSADMSQVGNTGGHMGTTARPFVERYIAPWLATPRWPAR